MVYGFFFFLMMFSVELFYVQLVWVGVVVILMVWFVFVFVYVGEDQFFFMQMFGFLVVEFVVVIVFKLMNVFYGLFGLLFGFWWVMQLDWFGVFGVDFFGLFGLVFVFVVYVVYGFGVVVIGVSVIVRMYFKSLNIYW